MAQLGRFGRQPVGDVLALPWRRFLRLYAALGRTAADLDDLTGG